MKISKLYITAFIACLAFIFTACKEGHDPLNPEGTAQKDGNGRIAADISSMVGYFQVTLLDGYPKQEGNNWVWVWKVINTDPSKEELHYWGISLGNCVTMENVVSMAWSRWGTTWYDLDIPDYDEDPTTTSCNDDIGNTLRFYHGTAVDCPTYYKLVLNIQVDVSTSALAMVKYGDFCSVGTIAGLGGDCGQEIECYTDEVLTFAGNRSFQLTNYQYTRYVTNGLGTNTTYNLKDIYGNIYGTVTVSDNTSTVTVTFNTTNDYYLTDTYLDVACSESGLHAYGGYPLLNNFDYHDVFTEPYVQTYSYTFDNPMCNCNSVYLMTYANVVSPTECP